MCIGKNVEVEADEDEPEAATARARSSSMPAGHLRQPVVDARRGSGRRRRRRARSGSARRRSTSRSPAGRTGSTANITPVRPPITNDDDEAERRTATASRSTGRPRDDRREPGEDLDRRSGSRSPCSRRRRTSSTSCGRPVGEHVVHPDAEAEERRSPSSRARPACSRPSAAARTSARSSRRSRRRAGR